jgi:hypothetical protein
MARDEQTDSEENASAGSRGKEGSVKDLPEMALFRIQKRGRGRPYKEIPPPYPVRLYKPLCNRNTAIRSTDEIRFESSQ